MAALGDRLRQGGQTDRRAAPAGLPGVQSFLLENTDMLLVDGLSRLLQLMEDAPDEPGALAAGCAWVQRQAERASVGIVTPDGQRLVAACGWKATDVSGEIAAILAGPARDARLPDTDREAPAFGVSIRHGGAVIGHLVVRGQRSDRPALQPVAQALAAVCGSALRACLDALALKEHERDCAPEILGRSQVMSDLRAAIARAGATAFPVLIEG
jgi:hypothetical protein